MLLTTRHAGVLQGRTSIELITGETPDISEYLDFGWYDIFWFKEDAGLGETQIGQFLGPSYKLGSLISYWKLLASGIPVSRTAIQCVTYLETCTNAIKKRFEVYEEAIKEIYHEKYTEEAFVGPNSTKPTMEIWAQLAEDDEDLQSDFNKLFDNPDAKESDDEFTPDL